MKPTKSLFTSILIISAITISQFAFPHAAFAAHTCGGFPSTIYYVDSSAPVGGNDGCGWSTAYLTLQDALAGTAANGDEIRVANGTYYPDVGSGQTNNDRNSTFSLIDGVSIYGGFAGFGAPNPDLRNSDPATNGTVLSGDIDGVAGNAGNAYHVVTALSINAITELSGFTIRDGNADGVVNFGGGMYISSSSNNLRVTDAIFTSNTAFSGGGDGDLFLQPSHQSCGFQQQYDSELWWRTL